MTQDHTIQQSLNGNNTEVSTNELNEMTEVIANIPKTFTDSTTAIQEELEIVNNAITTWERIAPQLYQIRKRLLVCEELLSGKRNIESVQALVNKNDVVEKKKRGPAKGTKVFVRRKSEKLNDAVLEKIRAHIASDENYHKSKEIYAYLIENKIIDGYPGLTPDRAFAIALSRVDQDVIKYNNHYTIMAWGLPDFGTAEHARRKTLKSTVRGEKGTRVSSYGKEESAE